MRKPALVFLAFASPAILISFFLPPPWGEGLFVYLAAAFPVAAIGLGLRRFRGLRWLLFSLLLTLEASFLGMLLLRGQVHDGPWPAGVPLGAWLQLGGLFLLPILLVPLVFGLTFDRHVLPPER